MPTDIDQFASLLISQMPFYALDEARKRAKRNNWPPELYQQWLRSTREDRRKARLARQNKKAAPVS